MKAAKVHETELVNFVQRFAKLNYQTSLLQQRYLYLRENSPAAGWGIYVIDLQSEASIGIQVPAPLSEWATVDCGVRAMELVGARTLSIAGAKRKTNLDGSSDVLRVQDSMMNVFRQVFAPNDLLQVRGYTQSGYRRIAASEGIDVDDGTDLREVTSRMYVRGGIPEDISLAELRQAAAPFEIRWNASPQTNTLRDQARGNVLEWFLSRSDRRRLIGKRRIHRHHNDSCTRRRSIA